MSKIESQCTLPTPSVPAQKPEESSGKKTKYDKISDCLPAKAPVTVKEFGPLTDAERSLLDELEKKAVIGTQKTIQGKIERGMALKEIRDARLYRETHPTFELYLRDRWNIRSRQRALQLISSAEVLSNLSNAFDVKCLDDLSEASALELSKLDSEAQISAFKKAMVISPNADFAPASKAICMAIKGIQAKTDKVEEQISSGQEDTEKPSKQKQNYQAEIAAEDVLKVFLPILIHAVKTDASGPMIRKCAIKISEMIDCQGEQLSEDIARLWGDFNDLRYS